MAFIHRTFCEDCGAEVDDVFKHGPEVCPESEQNRKKRKADNDSWEKEYNRVSKAWEKWEKKNPLNHCIPSVSHLPNEIAVEGRCILVDDAEYPGELNDHGEPVADFRSGVLINPTWGEVALEFDKCIPTTGDYHHSFLEGLHQIKSKSELKKYNVAGDVLVLQFSTGS